MWRRPLLLFTVMRFCEVRVLRSTIASRQPRLDLSPQARAIAFRQAKMRSKFDREWLEPLVSIVTAAKMGAQ